MIRVIIIGVLRLLSLILNVILYPINLILETAVPSVENVFTHINEFFSTIENYALFGLSYTGIQPAYIQVMTILLIAIITIPMLVHALKLIARWWETLI